MKEDLMEKLKFINRTAEILMEHYESRPFKNSIMGVGLRNIIGISQEAIDEIEKEKAPEPPVE
jgi:hypothetical protein